MKIKILTCVIAALTVVACGSGGSSGSGDAVPQARNDGLDYRSGLAGLGLSSGDDVTGVENEDGSFELRQYSDVVVEDPFVTIEGAYTQSGSLDQPYRVDLHITDVVGSAEEFSQEELLILESYENLDFSGLFVDDYFFVAAGGMGSTDTTDLDGSVLAFVPNPYCSAGVTNFNWVVVDELLDFDTQQPGVYYYGSGSWTGEAEGNDTRRDGTIGVAGVYDLNLDVVSSEVLQQHVTCENGALITNYRSENDFDFYLLGEKSSFISFGGESYIMAIEQRDIADVSDLEASYYGLAYFADHLSTDDFPVSFETGSQMFEVAVTLDANGDGSLVQTSSGVSFGGLNLGSNFEDASTDEAPEGFVTGLLTSLGGTSGNLACAVDLDADGSATKLLACTVQSPYTTTYAGRPLMSLLLVSESQTP